MGILEAILASRNISRVQEADLVVFKIVTKSALLSAILMLLKVF